MLEPGKPVKVVASGVGNYLLNTSTVHDNGMVNNLYGGSGTDWYFAGIADILFNQTTGEVVTQI